jgi:predicted chitinase
VQLTWKDNYQRAGEKLGIGDDLVIHPEKVLDSDIAYQIISFGMVNGAIFANGHKFSDYVHGKKMNYVSARQMVNGVDHNHDIAAIAEQLEIMLRASLTLFAAASASGAATTP